MSFNIRYDNNGDKSRGRGWGRRCWKVAELINGSEAAIVGTQEGLKHQLGQLQQDLLAQGQTFQSVGSPRSKWMGLFPSGEHAAVLYNSRSVQCEGAATIALSKCPDRLGTRSWGSACPRIATFAWIRIGHNLAHPMYVLVANTHLDHESALARLRGSELIVSKLNEMESVGPPLLNSSVGRHVGTIVLGDFNCLQYDRLGRCGDVFGTFLDAGFRDACGAGNSLDLMPCPFRSFHDWQPQASIRGSISMGNLEVAKQVAIKHGHIDWILWRGKGMSLQSFEVLSNVSNDGPPPSDHFPIVARFHVT